jgi:lipopolysaccharide export system permease protein
MALFAIPLSRTDSRRGRYARLGPALLVFLLYFVALSQARTISEDSSSALSFIVVHVLFMLSGLYLLFKEELSQWVRGRV